jgi:hypothetical protein
MAKSQLSSQYNGRSNDSSNPHSPRLDNWQSDRSRDWSDSYINGPSNDTSNPHFPGLDSWQSNRTDGEGKGSSSGIYGLKTDNGQVPAVAAAAQAAKDRHFRAFQEELGLSSDNNGEALAPSTPQMAAAQCLVAPSPQQREDGAPGK